MTDLDETDAERMMYKADLLWRLSRESDDEDRECREFIIELVGIIGDLKKRTDEQDEWIEAIKSDIHTLQVNQR